MGVGEQGEQEQHCADAEQGERANLHAVTRPSADGRPVLVAVEEQVEKGDYSTPSEYVRTLIREAQAKVERKALEAKLIAGLESPVSPMTTQDWAALRQRILDRNPELASE